MIFDLVKISKSMVTKVVSILMLTSLVTIAFPTLLAVNAAPSDSFSLSPNEFHLTISSRNSFEFSTVADNNFGENLAFSISVVDTDNVYNRDFEIDILIDNEWKKISSIDSSENAKLVLPKNEATEIIFRYNPLSSNNYTTKTSIVLKQLTENTAHALADRSPELKLDINSEIASANSQSEQELIIAVGIGGLALVIILGITISSILEKRREKDSVTDN